MFQTCYYDKLNELHPNPVNPCDSSSTATYSQSIGIIVRSNCGSCHSGSSPSGGVSLETYTQTKAAAENGTLMGTIRHEQGQKQMPPTSKIRDCEIEKLENWILNGKPEN